MKKILLYAASVILLAISCSKEDDAPKGDFQKTDGEKAMFYATMEGRTVPGTGTKVYADEDLLVLWNADDRISIFNKTTYNYEYAFKGEDGDNYGRFEQEPVSGFISGNDISHIYAVYPYYSSTKVNNTGTQITIDLPGEQTYKENSFGIGANTMVAVTDDQFLLFKNVCGYLKFRFWGDNVNVSSITLEGNNGEKIAGRAVITPVANGSPTIAMNEAATGSITLTCEEPVTLGNSSAECTEFIFVVPPTTFSEGFKVVVTDSEGGVFEKSYTGSLTIARNRMESMGAMEVIPIQPYVIFDDANFKAYCVSNFDTDGDGEISSDEALNVTRISVYTYQRAKDIKSMKGIERFINLRYLKCSGVSVSSGYMGQLTSLDVSKNILLDTLRCDYNYITSLDVSNNTSLTYLNCGQNLLPSLNVDNNTSLLYLQCFNNQLTSLNVSNNAALAVLDCHSNPITSLDLSHNPLLICLDCRANQLTTLDVNNHQLTELRIEDNLVLATLKCQNNQLTGLNLSNCPSLAYMECGGNQLTALNVSDRQLTYLDLGSNPDLTVLKCQNNQLTSLDLSDCPSLTYLECYSNQLSNLDVSYNLDLTRLLCYSNQLPSLNVKRNTALTYLDCCSNLIGSLDLSTNTQLTELHCDSNQLASLDLRNNALLTDVYCSSNLLTSLKLNSNSDTPLTKLVCSSNRLPRLIISYSPNLQTLDVSNNTAMTALLCQYCQLTSLNVSGCTALSEFNCNDNQLTTLDVSTCTSLYDFECQHNQLTSLDLLANNQLWYLRCDSNQLESLDIRNCASISGVYAWPQTGVTLAKLWKKRGIDINYGYFDPVTDDLTGHINPYNYGTQVIEVD